MSQVETVKEENGDTLQTNKRVELFAGECMCYFSRTTQCVLRIYQNRRRQVRIMEAYLKYFHIPLKKYSMYFMSYFIYCYR